MKTNITFEVYSFNSINAAEGRMNHNFKNEIESLKALKADRHWIEARAAALLAVAFVDLASYNEQNEREVMEGYETGYNWPVMIDEVTKDVKELLKLLNL